MKRFLLCIGMLAVPTFANIIVGLPPDPGTGDCFPFGCAYSGEYQQVYTHSVFPGPITITGLEFFNTVFNNFATSMNSGNWTISLSTTGADWNTLSGTFALNIGGNNTQVFSGNLSQAWAFGDTLAIVLSSPFTYNPAGGNLLMDVTVSNASDSGGLIFFDGNGFNGITANGNTIMGRAYGAGRVDHGFGLVTEFVTSPSTVPEPSPRMLLETGLGLLAIVSFVRLARRS